MRAEGIFDSFARSSYRYPASFQSAVQESEQSSSRREAVGALVAVASVLAATPAHAFLGIGETSENDTYIEDTVIVLCPWSHFLVLKGRCDGDRLTKAVYAVICLLS